MPACRGRVAASPRRYGTGARCRRRGGRSAAGRPAVRHCRQQVHRRDGEALLDAPAAASHCRREFDETGYSGAALCHVALATAQPGRPTRVCERARALPAGRRDLRPIAGGEADPSVLCHAVLDEQAANASDSGVDLLHSNSGGARGPLTLDHNARSRVSVVAAERGAGLGRGGEWASSPQARRRAAVRLTSLASKPRARSSARFAGVATYGMCTPWKKISARNGRRAATLRSTSRS
eukprot:2625120-Prymnesium_polylepis.2